MSDELLTEMIGVEQALMGYEDPDPLTSELLQIEQQFSDDWVYKRAKTARHQENYAERDAAYRRDFPDRPIPSQQQAGRMSMWDLADRYTRQEGDIRVPHPSDLNKIPEEDRPTFLSMVSELAAEKTEAMEERGAMGKLKVRATRAWENWGLNMSQTVRTVVPGLIDKEIAKDSQFKRMATQARRGGDPAKGRTYLGEAFLQAIDMAPAMVGSVPLYYGLGAVAPALGKVGGLAYWTSQIMPQRVDEMVRKGVDPKLAQTVGVVDAMVEAQIEQMNLIMEPGPAASFAGVAGQFALSYLKEWGEEALQGLTAMGALRVATWIDPKAPEPDWGQEGRDLIKELKQVAVPLAIMMAPGMALGVSGQIRGIPGVQLAQQQRDDLLTPEGAAQWAIKYPMSAEELAEGTRAPSRKVISEMLPNVQMNAKQRAEFARQVKDMFPEVKKFYETWDRAHEFIAEKAQEQPAAEEVEDAVQERGPEEIPVLPEAGVGEQVGAQVRVAEEPAVEGVAAPAVEPGVAAVERGAAPGAETRLAAEAAARAGEAGPAASVAPEAAGPPRRGLAGYAPEAPGAEAEAEPLPVRRGAEAEVGAPTEPAKPYFERLPTPEEGYDVSAKEVQQKSPREKPKRSGLTKIQSEYLGERLAHIGNLLLESDEKAGPFAIHVPDDGTFRVKDVIGALNLHRRVTGKNIPGKAWEVIATNRKKELVPIHALHEAKVRAPKAEPLLGEYAEAMGHDYAGLRDSLQKQLAYAKANPEVFPDTSALESHIRYLEQELHKQTPEGQLKEAQKEYEKTRRNRASSLARYAWATLQKQAKDAGIPLKGGKAKIIPQLVELAYPESEAPTMESITAAKEWVREAEAAPARKPLAEYAEEAAAEAEARPEAEYLSSVLPVPQDRTPLREDEIPGQIQAPRPEVEKRLQNARGIQRTPFLKKAGDVAKAAWHRVIRAQAHIPRTDKFASANNFFRLLKDVPNQVLDEVSRMVGSIIDPMGKKQLGLFERKLIVDNMAAGLARGEPLRFGFQTAEEVAGYKAQLDELAARSPDIQKALDTRQKIVNSLVGELIDRDMLPKEIADRTDEYFHQQVLGHLQAQRFAISTKARGQKRAFQKRRVKGVDTFGPEFDYNTSYIEAEITWMRDAMTELRKAEHLDRLAGLYDILPQLKQEAKAQERSWEEAVAEMPDHGLWQPQPGNVFYRALSVPDKVVEEMQRQLISIEQVPEKLRQVLAMGGPSKQMVLPNPIIEQLQSLEKPKPTGPIEALSTGAMKSWKVWTLLWPKRALQYNLRNFTGDMDPVIGAAPEVLPLLPRARRELSKYHRGYLTLPADLKDARDLAVVSSSMTAEEIPDLKEMKVFKRFYKSKLTLAGVPRAVAGIPKAYFDLVRNFTEYRENLLRYASYLYYLKEMKAGTLTNYGGAQKSVVDQLMEEQGPKVAAAHLSRNLLGDYGNLSVMGNWMRRHLVPFWSWMEINTKRWPRLFLNAAQAGHLRTLGKTVPHKALFSALAIGQLGIGYGIVWLWNNLKHPDEEKDLARWDRANPHINLGRNEDGSVRVFRNVGAFGDFAEWFGINTLLSLLPLYQSGQITISDILTESAKDPLNKFIGGIRPDLKGMFEILPGQSYFPDVFNPRAIERGEAAAGIFGLQDEWRWVQGVFGRGKRARPNYIQRYFVGVVDPKKNALHEMYDLRERFLAQKGKEAPPLQTISAIRDMREAAIAEDYDAFKEARGVYLEKGKKWSNFKSSLSYLDPISQRLNARDEAEFEHKFLTGTQRLKLGVAREYSQTLKTRLWRWWQEASKEAKK